jgi:threonine dehydrogenase-like Zn-dependent dehydrogenase
MSVAAKAIDEAMIVQGARLNSFTPGTNWLENKKAIIAGIGPIGLMAAFALRLRGAKVVGMDIVDEDTLRPQLLKQIGGIYVDGRKVRTTDLDEVCGEADFVFEATGIAKLQIELLDSLAVNGIYVATGIPGGHRPMTIQAGDIMQQLVLKNQILLGSVNASIAHYKMAVRDLQASVQRWPGVVEQVITERVPYIRFAESLEPHSANEIKVVIDWS